MEEIYFATSNQMKFEEACMFFKAYAPHIMLKQCTQDFEEIQTMDQQAIALHKAQQAWDYLKKPVIADDAGIYFGRYKQFPGTLTKFIYKGIGYEGILRLIDHNDPAFFKLSLIFAYGANQYKMFEASCHGRLIHTKNFDTLYASAPFDALFIPDGTQKTFDRLRREGILDQYNYRIFALKDFVHWYNHQHKKEEKSKREIEVG